MICRECAHTFTGDSEGDRKMEKLGYKSCRAAQTPEEKARYIRGSSECMYPVRFKAL
jgi:hypothetical protein